MIRSRLVLFMTICLFFILVSVGFLVFRSYRMLVLKALRLQAIGFMISLKSLVSNIEPEVLIKKRELFYDMLLDRRWEGLAYVALISEDGRFVIHSNYRLIGKFSKSFSLAKSYPVERFGVLKTGLEVYEYEDLVRIGGKNYVLRVALFKDPVEENFFGLKVFLIVTVIVAVLTVVVGGVIYYVLEREERVRRKLEELEKIAFISKAFAHEIRNPLATIKGFSEFLLEKLSRNDLLDGVTLTEYLSIVKEESERIERLIQNLVAYSYGIKVEEGKEVELVSFVKSILDRFSKLNPNVRFSFNSYMDNIMVHVSRESLNVILENVLQNALDAIEGVLEPEILVEIGKLGNYYFLKVKDNGMGMDEDLVAKVFEPFFTTKARGMGLGLAIVKRIIDEIGGKIEIKGERGKGTEVILCLPS